MEVALPDGPPRIGLFELRRSEAPRRGGGPLARICGLPLLVRNLLLLSRRGYARAILLIEPEHESSVERALAQRAIAMPVTVETRAPTLAAAVGGSGELGSAEVLYWPGTLSFGRYLPEIAEARALPDQVLSGYYGDVELGLYVFHASLLESSDAPDGAAFAAECRTKGMISSYQIQLVPTFVRSLQHVRYAERDLLRSLRKNADGVVAKFDRYVSLAISKQLMKLPVTPNLATLGAGALGIGGALLAARGGYWPMLLGALGFQLNSVFDGIDGEIARAKLLESRLGQWLDTVTDDVCNLSFALGVAIGVFRNTGSRVYLALGALAVIGFVVAAAFMYHYLVTVAHSGDLNDFRMPWDTEERTEQPDLATAAESSPARGAFARFFAAVRFLGRRDAFTLMATILAVLGQMQVMAWLFAIGASYLAGSIAFGHLAAALRQPPRAA